MNFLAKFLPIHQEKSINRPKQSHTTQWQYDPFFQQAVKQQPLSTGDVNHLPVKYFDASSLIAFFLVDYKKAQQVVRSHQVEVIKLARNKALFSIAFYDYRELTDGNPYFEVSPVILVRPKQAGYHAKSKLPLLDMALPTDRRNTGFWVVDLPVTDKLACVAGVEGWGYPKFVTEIDFRLSDDGFMGAVKHPQDNTQDIVRLQGQFGNRVPAPWSDLVLYSELDGDLIRATSNTRTINGAKLAGKGDFVLTVGQSTHPMAQRLRQLGVDGAQPLSVTYTDSLQLRLNEGVVFGEALQID